MTFEEFIQANHNKLLGFHLLSEISAEPYFLEAPRPQDTLPEEALEELKYQLNRCMPLDSMIIDLWDWDIHFESDLEDDWYFDAVFGATSGVEHCATTLAEFFSEKCNEYGMDYDQSPDEDPQFEAMVLEESRSFIVGWRKAVVQRYAKASLGKGAAESGRT